MILKVKLGLISVVIAIVRGLVHLGIEFIVEAVTSSLCQILHLLV